MVAVGLSPRTAAKHTIRRRGATAERSLKKVVLNRRSATRHHNTRPPWTEVHGYHHGLAPRGAPVIRACIENSLSHYQRLPTNKNPQRIQSARAVALHDTKIGRAPRRQAAAETHESGRVNREAVRHTTPMATQHLRGAKDAVDGPERRAGVIAPARLAHDPVGADFDLERADGVTARWRPGGSHRVGRVTNRVMAERAVDQPKQRR